MADDERDGKGYRYWKQRWFDRHDELCRQVVEELGGWEEIRDDPELEERRRERVQELKEEDEKLQRAKRRWFGAWQEVIDQACPDGTKADKIRAVKREYPWVGNSFLAEFLDTTKGYVQSFRPGVDGDVVQNKVDETLREKVIERDGGDCARCGSEESLVVHHIIPIRACEDGEANKPENLATLCSDCHLEAHGGDFYVGRLPYGSIEEFWEWIQEGP